jgi:CrcB protein
MKQLFLVFLGGGLGSSLRYLISKWLNTNVAFPLGTFTVNIIGSLIFGVILGYIGKGGNISPYTSLLLATGFCGGFTTFSAFSYENNVLLKSGDFLNFSIYTACSIGAGILAGFAGIWISKYL